MIPCGFFEEGTGLAFNCYTSRRTFGRLSPRIEINQIFEELSYCDSNGTCHDNDPSRYSVIIYLHQIKSETKLTHKLSKYFRVKVSKTKPFSTLQTDLSLLIVLKKYGPPVINKRWYSVQPPAPLSHHIKNC